MGQLRIRTNRLLSFSVLWTSICLLFGEVAAASIRARGVWQGTNFGPMLEPYWIGGSGGVFFHDCPLRFKGNGALVKRLEIWSDGSKLQALKTYYTDGSSSVRGKNSGDPKGTLDLAPGELISYLEIWLNSDSIAGNSDGTRAARVQMSTSLGQTLDVGNKDGSFASKQMDVGGGVLVGSIGNAGSEIDSLGFVFLRSPILSVEMTDLSYPEAIIGLSTGITDRKLDDLRQVRNENDPDTFNWSFSGATQISQSHTFTSSTTNTYGVKQSIEVSAQFLGIGVKSTTEFSWQLSQTETQSTTDTLSYTETWGQTGTLERGQGVHVQASVAVGKISLPYTATVKVTLEDGSAFTYQDKGIYKNVGYSSVFVTREIYNATSGVSLRKSIVAVGERDH